MKCLGINEDLFTCSEDDIQKELDSLSIENQGGKSKEAEKVF